MRIIGGKFKGRRIVPIHGLSARPTTDFAREALFNILNNRIDFASIAVLDLFSGTGSVSYEFASRGVRIIHLVEKEMRYISGIRRFIDDIGISGIKPIHIDVVAYLKTCTYKYDIIFADPPYDLKWIKSIPDLVRGSGALNEDGFLIVEHPLSVDFKSHDMFFEHRKYGNVNFSFFNLKRIPGES